MADGRTDELEYIYMCVYEVRGKKKGERMKVAGVGTAGPKLATN